MRRKLQAAYEQPTYDKAKATLKRVRSELALMNQSAARRAVSRVVLKKEVA
jgi:hypothetical protein